MNVQDDLNLHILLMFEGTFWLDVDYIQTAKAQTSLCINAGSSLFVHMFSFVSKQ